ncbi:MAG: HAMP domain-containing protein [Acidobacteria bacterium]|nr:HAMP domain-containing protein [Acidobacteriota bacterium]
MRSTSLGINLDKIFPKLSIRAKLLIGFLGLALVPSVVVGAWAAREAASGLRARALDSLAEAATERARAIEVLDASIEEDLRYLATHPSFGQLLRQSVSEHREASRAEIESAFLTFSQGRRAYYQVRYIDGTGHEVIRINYQDGRAVAVPRHELQDKSDRYYVREGLARAPGQIYVSPMDLNVEYGRIEEPPQPVVRYTLSLGDNGRTRGLLVVNLFAAHLFALLEPLRVQGHVTLLDERGTYLASSDGGAISFSMLRRRSLAADEPPEVVRRVLSGPGSLLTPGGTAYGFSPIRGAAEAWGRRWVLAVMAPEAEAIGAARRASRAIALGALLAGALAAVFGALAAWRLSRPIEALSRAAERVAGGDFSARVLCDTNDEIEDLAGRFNEMTERLGHAQAALARWNEDLRHAVEERTRELAQEREKLAGVVSGMEGGLCLLDRARRVVWANRALTREYGDAVVGRPCTEAFGCVQPCAECPGEDVLRGQQVVRRLITRPGAGGEQRYVQVVAAPVHDAAGEVTHVIELSVDVTESVRREEAVVRAERLSALGRLSATVSHEVANPLAAIKTSLQALLDGPIEETRVRRFAVRAVAEVDRLAAFLRSFSTFARPHPAERVHVDLMEAARDAAALVEGTIRVQRLRLDLDLEPATALADGGQIRQVLLNLLLNAVEASPVGGRLALVVRPARLAGTPAACLEVADEGPGIDEDTRRRIFDPFFSTKPHGAGLGLSVVHQIVKDHGGHLELETAVGKGARFRVILPGAPTPVSQTLAQT